MPADSTGSCVDRCHIAPAIVAPSPRRALVDRQQWEFDGTRRSRTQPSPTSSAENNRSNIRWRKSSRWCHRDSVVVGGISCDERRENINFDSMFNWWIKNSTAHLHERILFKINMIQAVYWAALIIHILHRHGNYAILRWAKISAWFSVSKPTNCSTEKENRKICGEFDELQVQFENFICCCTDMPDMPYIQVLHVYFILCWMSIVFRFTLIKVLMIKCIWHQL